MRISRHPVPDHVKDVFQEQVPRLSSDVIYARKQARSLSSLAGTARHIYRAGSVVAPDSPEVGRAIQLAAQANTAILMFARIEDPPRYCRLGDGPPVTYSEPVDESTAHVGRWLDAFEQATISRQSDLLAILHQIPNDRLMQSSTWGAEATYLWLNLLRAVGTERRFTKHPAFTAYEEYCANCQGRSAHCIAIRHLSVPYFEVLRQLESGDEIAFDAALTEALQLHKKYWGATEKRRKDFNGFVSLQMTAAAALAWDRGMRFKVESDYMPTSWVRGDLFRNN